jgi:hypothetical protein
MNYDHVWHFEWKTQPAGFLDQEESGWVLEGRLHTSPDTGWIVAHDVFHHLPGDTGTYAEEITTFGAEAWLEHADDREKLRRSLATSWFSVMALTIENGSRGVEGLRLPRQASSALPDSPLMEFFREVYRQALGEAQDTFGAFAEPDTWRRLQEEAEVNKAVGLALEGFRHAQARWPDPAEAQAQFNALSDLASPAEAGARLTVAVSGGQLTMVRDDPKPEVQRKRGPRP